MTQGEGQARIPMTGLLFTEKPNLEGPHTRQRQREEDARSNTYGLTCLSGPLLQCRRQRRPRWRCLSSGLRRVTVHRPELPPGATTRHGWNM